MSQPAPHRRRSLWLGITIGLITYQCMIVLLMMLAPEIMDPIEEESSPLVDMVVLLICGLPAVTLGWMLSRKP